MITRASNIHSPGDQTLAVWKAMSDALQFQKSLAENPEAIDAVTQKIIEAHQLTQAEKDERTAAVKAVEDAKKELLAVQLQHANALDLAARAKEDADEAVKAIYAGARKAKEDADKYSADKKKEYDDKILSLIDREDDLREREESVSEAKKSEEAWRKEKAAWEKEKEDWESDYSKCMEKLNEREKRALKK